MPRYYPATYAEHRQWVGDGLNPEREPELEPLADHMARVFWKRLHLMSRLADVEWQRLEEVLGRRVRGPAAPYPRLRRKTEALREAAVPTASVLRQVIEASKRVEEEMAGWLEAFLRIDGGDSAQAKPFPWEREGMEGEEKRKQKEAEEKVPLHLRIMREGWRATVEQWRKEGKVVEEVKPVDPAEYEPDPPPPSPPPEPAPEPIGNSSDGGMSYEEAARAVREMLRKEVGTAICWCGTPIKSDY